MEIIDGPMSTIYGTDALAESEYYPKDLKPINSNSEERKLRKRSYSKFHGAMQLNLFGDQNAISGGRTFRRNSVVDTSRIINEAK